jgi:hypothetical protein
VPATTAEYGLPRAGWDLEQTMFVLPALCLLFTAFARLGRARARSVVDWSDRRAILGAFVLLAANGGTELWGLALAMATFAALLLKDCHSWAVAALAARRQASDVRSPQTDIDYGVGADWTMPALPSDPYRASAHPIVASLGSPSEAARALRGNVTSLLLLAAASTCFETCACICVVPRHTSYIAGAKTQLNTVRSATLVWRSGHPECPSIAQLKADSILDSSFNDKDPWGNLIELTCESDEIIARTAGPDRKKGTDDDIQIPVPVP